MEMVDRYVYAVTERLPEDIRVDVAKELRANIEDMLPDNADEKDVHAVLEKLGDPVTLANEYRQTKKYLIGPALYDNYISVLKLVIGIAIIVFTFLALLGNLSKPVDGAGFAGVIASALSGALEGAVQAFMWVTVIFAVFERCGVNEGSKPFIKHKWTVNDLQPATASSKSKIPPSEAIVSIVFTVIFTVLLIYRPQLIGWYEKGKNGIELIAPVFNTGSLKPYIPAIILLALFQLCLSVYKFISRKWVLPLAIANTLNNLALSILICVLLTDARLLNPEFVLRLGNLFKTSSSHIMTMLNRGFTIFSVIFILGCALDSVMGFMKCRSLNLGINKTNGQ